ncbi:hypothetical protein HDF16_005323 [Granulicella aggregans]|uniref:Uncharacterized protein n=1 Tax=Granulicella aggregans TaxID=474949 RepID=A0A7W8E6E2_9BACT|nr:hypothetical protein [Granulicella aggregans]
MRIFILLRPNYYAELRSELLVNHDAVLTKRAVMAPNIFNVDLDQAPVSENPVFVQLIILALRLRVTPSLRNA